MTSTMKKIILTLSVHLLVGSISLFAQKTVFGGDYGNNTSGFGKGATSAFDQTATIQSDWEDWDNGGPGGSTPGVPEDIPIDGGVALLLLGGLAIGAKRIFRQIMDKAQ